MIRGSFTALGLLAGETSQMLLFVLIFPLLGAILLAPPLYRRRSFDSLSGWLATFFSTLSFLVVCRAALELRGVGSLSFVGGHWFVLPEFAVRFSLSFDRLTAVMCLFVTGVGTLIHFYAIGYMREDDAKPRFFCYLNLFLFSMLLLVLAGNLLVLFVGWEGVGLCSYLLIGFWFRQPENAKAGQKAFVVNRIGDAGFLLGIFFLIAWSGTVEFDELEKTVPYLGSHLKEALALLFLIGAMGKSAQLPLFIWLPDAMAGPTPVSALIHAATMVTAGIYMITRMAFLYVHAPYVLLLISIVGTMTAFIAATIALVQHDIKRVLAYSTISQLGYMFMALGAGAFSNAIYHVVTHSFFKALLFLAAGSVIVGCHHEQDMRRLGGLWRKMWCTTLAYAVGTLAIAGVPPFSGFFSKDAILWTVYTGPGMTSSLFLGDIPLNHALWFFGMLTAFITGCYMTRSFVLTFLGKNFRGSGSPHESPWTMTLPLAVLILFSTAFAWACGDYLMQVLGQWTRSDMRIGHEALSGNAMYATLEMLSIIVALSGVFVGLLVYLWGTLIPAVLVRAFRGTYGLFCGKWWIDDLASAFVVKPLAASADALFQRIDRSLVDGAVDRFALCCVGGSEIARRLQAGRLGVYVFLMFFAVLLILCLWLQILA